MGTPYRAGDLWTKQGAVTRRTQRLLFRRGLAVVTLSHGRYLLPAEPCVQGLAAAVRAGDRAAAGVLSDYLQEHGIPRPAEVLVLLSETGASKSVRKELESLRAQAEQVPVLRQEIATLRRRLEDARQRHVRQSRKMTERTPLGKRRSVLAALRDPRNAALGNREVARRCGVSEGLVRRLRADLSAHGTQIGFAPEGIEVRRGESVYTMRGR